MNKLVIGSRESRLAVVQSNLVVSYLKQQYPDMEVSLLTMKTTGDKILDRTLDKIGGKGLFVKELDRALMEKRSHLSVHSLKDMPMEVSKELPLVGFSKREDPRDVLILPKGCTKLEEGKPIGCSSLRRIIQAKELFKKMEFKPIRGNVLTRLEKLDKGEYSALILAAAGMKRLGLEERIHRYFDTKEILPSAGQGILALQGREGIDYSFLDEFCNEESMYMALAERAYVKTLDGGCSSPIAAHGTINGNLITLTGLYYDEGSNSYCKGSLVGPKDEAVLLGQKLARDLKEQMEASLGRTKTDE